jgi:tetratricopeptide (TPR) repeat protein
VVQSYVPDESGQPVETSRRDDVLEAVSSAAHGTIVAAELPDQAGAVRELVSSFKRSRSSETRTEQGRPRAWLAILAASMVLLAQAAVRRTAALIALALAFGAGRAEAQDPRSPSYPRHPGDKAWDAGDARRAAAAYLQDLERRPNDGTRYNAGTAALAAGDAALARTELEQAASSADPDIRFRALYNLGVLTLRLARADSVHRDAHLSVAERAYREALRLKPDNLAAKWNLELTQRQRAGGGQSGGGGGGGDGTPPPPGAPPPQDQAPQEASGLSTAQAEEILRSIGQEELRTRRDRAGRMRRTTPPGVKDW